MVNINELSLLKKHQDNSYLILDYNQFEISFVGKLTERFLQTKGRT
jgi:hypothetical protein